MVMKKLRKLKLNALAEMALEDKEMNSLRGGDCCFCSCYWADYGGSASDDNRSANYQRGDGTASKYGCNQYVQCGDGSGVTSMSAS